MNKTLEYIRARIKDFNPCTGIILGSGLGGFADEYKGISLPYSDIPGFQTPKVNGHKGMLHFARIFDKNTVIMQGRYHYYEGYSMQTVAYPVKVMKLLGVKTLIITNAAGAVNADFRLSNFMLITDHINFTGANPLSGENDDRLGIRFPDMSEVYSKDLIIKAEQAAEKLGITVYKGVYAGSAGPSYETPAEIKMYRLLGADAIGMSSVPEAVTAKWCGMDILGISCLTNYAAGVSSNSALAHSDVINTAAKSKDNFCRLLKEILKII